MKMTTRIFAILSVLLLFSLACAQAGEILTPEEATQRVEAARGTPTVASSAEDAEFQIGDTVGFSSTGFLVPLYRNPGDNNAFSHVSRNDTAVIQSSRIVDETFWYQITSVGGRGWVKGDYLRVLEGTATPAP